MPKTHAAEGNRLRRRTGLVPGEGRRPQKRALTVSELTDRILGVLETEFLDVWVEGEISNLRFMPSSGHFYFSLKDDKAQIKAVVWRSDARYLKFKPQDGMKVVARGQIRVYAPRGEYQMSVQLIEPLGKGSLQQAFEELKERLAKEGLFAPERKRPLPVLPRRIGLVTSPTGRRGARHPARAREPLRQPRRCSSIPAGCRDPRPRGRSWRASAR